MKIIQKISLCVLSVLVAFSVVSSVRADDATPPADTTPPVITLVGDASVSISQGATYTDSGATASDDVDGNITANIHVAGTVDTTTAGSYTLTYSVSDAAGNPATPVTRTVTVTPVVVVHPLTETVLIRNGSTIIDQETVSLPASGTVTITDDAGATHSVNADSVLGLLFAMSQGGTFSLSDLTYYSSFSSLYLKCLTPNGGSALCDNWQFVVGGTSPWTSIDQTILSGGETVGLYFGSSHRVRFDTTQVTTGGSVHATAEQYNYLDNSWSPLTGVSVGVTVPNPNDPYNPTVVSSVPVDAQGNATLSFPNSGTFSVGVVEDYYFPSYTVTATAAVQTSGGGGGSGGGVLLETTSPQKTALVLNTQNAFTFLKQNQNTDGSFSGGDMYTDWAGVAFGAIDKNQTDPATQKLIQYLSTHALVKPRLTDYERRAIAELALGQNPYTFGGVDVVTPVVQSFDGTQFGDANLINDDVFALIALESAGYTSSDALIAKDVAYILSKQGTDGSWEAGVDMTSATVQALSPLASVNGVSDALKNASTYLAQSEASDGGFGSAYTTSWVAQAMNVLKASWTKNGHDALGFLAGSQQTDGGLLLASDTMPNRIWATSYAIPAGLGLSWNAVLHSVARPVVAPKLDQTVAPVSKTVSSVGENDGAKPKQSARHNLGALSTALAVQALENPTQTSTQNAPQTPAEQSHPKKTFKQSVIAIWHTLVHTLTSW
ncbi:MAG: immunoglobulin-like domain-containing protein [bacterium]